MEENIEEEPKTLEESPIQNMVSIGIFGRYHVPLRQAYSIIWQTLTRREASEP